MEKLYLNTKESFKTIEDLIIFMFPYGMTYCNEATYFDEQCKERQGKWNRRSINDLYIICQTYFPEATKFDILKAIENCKLHFYICFDIDRLVFHRVLGKSEFSLQNIIEQCLEKYKDYLNWNTSIKGTILEIIELLKNEKQCLEKDSLEQEVG